MKHFEPAKQAYALPRGATAAKTACKPSLVEPGPTGVLWLLSMMAVGAVLWWLILRALWALVF